jgi:type IV pilus assembly protein PilO
MKFGIRELIFVILIIGVLGLAYPVFARAKAKRESLKKDTATKRTALANLKQATAGIEDVEKKIEELQNAISFFEKKLPAEKEVDKVLKEVWQMAEANSLQTKTVKTLKSDKGPNYSEQPISMTLSGDFNGYYAFLLQLEKMPRITRVSQMKLEKISDRDGEMTANMILSIFFEPDAAAAAAAANNGATAGSSSASAR